MTLRSQMRQLSSQSLIYGLSGAFSKLVALVIVPILTHIFTPSDYGVIELITIFGSAVGSVLILGSDAAVGYYFYRETTEDGKSALLSTWLFFQFGLSILVGIVLYLLADPITTFLLPSYAHNDLYLQLMASVLPLSTTIAYLLEVLRLQMRPVSYVTIAAVNVFSGLALTLVLVVGMRLGLRGVYIASAITNVIAFCMAMALVSRTFRFTFSLPRLRSILAYGIPLVPISLSTWAIMASNRFFVKIHTGWYDVGLFTAGNKVAQIMALAVTAFSLAWGPFAYSIAQEADARRTYAKVLTYYVAGLGWLAVALSLFAPLILQIAAAPSYARAYQVVAPLTLSNIVAGAYSIVAIGTSLSRKTIHLSWTTIIAALVTVLLNAVLVPLPYLGLVGGALATLFGNLVSVTLVYIVSQRLYFIPFELRKLFVCTLVLSTMVLVGQFERATLGPNSALGITIRTVLILGYPLALVVLGVIERYEVVILRNSFRARWASV